MTPVRRLQNTQPARAVRWGEDLACKTLRALPGVLSDPEALALVNSPWERYREIAADTWFSGGNFPDRVDAATTMVKNLVVLRDVRGLVEAVRLLALLDGLGETPTTVESGGSRASVNDVRRFSEARQRGIESLQSIVNTYLPDPLKYDHLADQPDRRKMLARMVPFFESFRFEETGTHEK